MKIIVDTREHNGPFLFQSYADIEIVHQKMDTADYGILGLEHIVVVDRKKTLNELYTNLAKDSKRFNKELERMKDITFCYFVCCFPYSQLESFPIDSGIPKYRWKYLKVSGAYLRKRIKDIEEEYPNIKFIFCNNHLEGENITYQILKGHSGE